MEYHHFLLKIPKYYSDDYIYCDNIIIFGPDKNNISNEIINHLLNFPNEMKYSMYIKPNFYKNKYGGDHHIHNSIVRLINHDNRMFIGIYTF